MKLFQNGSPVNTSKRVFYVLIVLTLLVFGAFFLVGNRLPYGGRSAYHVPVYTDLLLGFMSLLLLAALAISVWSVVTCHLRRGKSTGLENRVPTRRTAILIAVGTLLLLLVSFLAAPSSAIRINAERYESAFWLKTAGMFVVASAVMMASVVAAILYDYIRRRRN